MYPLKFENLYFEKIWGGSDFLDFKEDLTSDYIGESWEISCHKNGMSIVKNGDYRRKTLGELIDEFKHKIVGRKIKQDEFPLLTKLISAKEQLSIQVHPNDEYACNNERSLGKTEAWYVLYAKEGAELIMGMNGCSRERFEEVVKGEVLEKYVNKVKVKKGDIYFIKSGLIHAISGGMLIMEIQQSSDITYRVYDYGRGRELNIDKALDVIDFDLKPEKPAGLLVDRENYTKTYLCISENFAIEKYDIKDHLEEKSDEDRFYILFILDGKGEMEYKGGKISIKKGESILIPAYLGEYKINGKMSFLKTYVPDFQRLKDEILKNCICN